jgi:hypothetical protein
MKALAFAIFLLLMSLTLDFPCVPPCPKAYSRQQDLSIHQAKCAYAVAPDPTLDAALERRRRRKRQKLELSQATPVASTSALATNLSATVGQTPVSIIFIDP